VPRPGYAVGVPDAGSYRKIFDSDDPGFGGSGHNRQHEIVAGAGSSGHPHSLKIDLPPLGAMFFLGPVEEPV